VNAADPLAVEAFHHTIERWHDYFLLAGTAAATLMGLLFVSLSIHLEKVVAVRGAHLEAMAREAFVSFVIVLAISLMFLSVDLSRRPLGVSMVMLGLIRGVLSVGRLRQALRSSDADRGISRSGLLARFAFPLAASGFLIWAGLMFLRGRTADAMVGVMTACLGLIADATRSAYELLVRTARNAARSA